MRPRKKIPAEKPPGRSTASYTSKPRLRLSRAEKSAATRTKLFAAAARVVGMEGYANASVAKITARAHVAQGTFYNYFQSQQDLFDQLLPELGQQLLDDIRKRLGTAKDSLERERIGFTAFFEFLHRRPEFYRVLNEAETFSPKAFRDHMDNMIQGYLRALRRSRQKGELAAFGDDELDVVVCVLLAARNYLAYHYLYREGASGEPPPVMVDAYMKFVTGGLGYGERRTRADSRPPRSADGGVPKIEIVSADASASLLKLHLSEPHRDFGGAARPATMLKLIETAGAAVASRRSGRAMRLFNISVGSLARSRAQVLVASAHCEQQVNGIVQVSVRLTEGKPDGAVAAIGQLLFTAEHDPQG